MSRGQARKQLTASSLKKAMAGKTWNSDKADRLVDESPEAYKPIEQVMEDQKDLVEVVHTLHAFSFTKEHPKRAALSPSAAVRRLRRNR